jgi:CDP-glycerol glycerophosphotransferase (TagB/SpsB family)
MKHPNPQLRGLVDQYFCHGPIDGGLIEEQTGKKATMIGYPRYDTLKTLQETYSSELSLEFSLNPAKKIISWIPTYVNRNGNPDYNIDVWLPYLESLLTEYEILVRPHPKRIEMGAEKLIQRLEAVGFKVDVLAERDMNQLYSVSDFILCDYGGVVFSSIYTDSNLLMLNHPDHQSELESHRSLFVYKIREQLLNIDVEKLKTGQLNLSHLLSNEEIWTENKKLRDRLLAECFGGIKVGQGSYIAALKLKEFLENS